MKKQNKSSALGREIHPMPKKVKQALVKMGLWDSYQARPPFQRNDYVGWIARAKLDATKEKRTQQMFEELRQGDRYMNMKWNPR